MSCDVLLRRFCLCEPTLSLSMARYVRAWFKSGFGKFIFHCYQVRPHFLCAALMNPHRTKQHAVRRFSTVSLQIFAPFKLRPPRAKTCFGLIKFSACTAAACIHCHTEPCKTKFRLQQFLAKHDQAENS